MKSRKSRRRRKARVVSNPRRRRRRMHRAARKMTHRRNPARRSRRRRSRRPRYAVAHVVRRLNPPALTSKSTLGLAGGASMMAIVGCYIPSLTVKMMPNGTSTTTAHLVNAGLKLGLGYVGSKALQRTSPTVAQGVLVGAIVSVVYDVFSMISPGMAAPAAANSAGALASTTGTAGYGTGTTSTGTARYIGAQRRRGRMAAYLGANGQRRRRGKMAAYLGANGRNRRNGRARGMGQYLQPGQPITSLIGPVSAARRTNRAGALGALFTPTSIFPNAWAR